MVDYEEQNQSNSYGSRRDQQEQQAWEVDQAYFASFEKRLNYSQMEETPLPTLPDYSEMLSRYRLNSELSQAFHEAYDRLEVAWTQAYEQRSWDQFGTSPTLENPLEVKPPDAVPSLTVETQPGTVNEHQVTEGHDLASENLSYSPEAESFLREMYSGTQGPLSAKPIRPADEYSRASGELLAQLYKSYERGEQQNNLPPQTAQKYYEELYGSHDDRTLGQWAVDNLQEIPQQGPGVLTQLIDRSRDLFRSARSAFASLFARRKDDAL